MTLQIDHSTIHTDRLNYITVAAEDIWGRDPFQASGSGSGLQNAFHLPYETYDARFKTERRAATPKTGLMTAKHGTLHRGMVSGQMACALYGHVPEGLGGKSVAQVLIEWALGTSGGSTNDEQGKVLPSKTIRLYEENLSNKAHYGMRVNTATLTGSDDTGNHSITMEMMGQDESGTNVSVGSIPNNHHRLVDFDFQLSEFYIASVQVPVKQYQLVVGNGLSHAYNGGTRINVLVKTDRTYQLQMQLLKQASTYEAMARAGGMQEFAVQMVLRGLHDGTGASGTMTKCTIDIDRCSFADQEPQRGPIHYQQLNLVPLKPDTSNKTVRFTWATE